MIGYLVRLRLLDHMTSWIGHISNNNFGRLTMELKAIVCPHCGARLDIEENTTLTTCPYCDCKIHISYDDEKKPEPRQFKTAEGLPIA